MAKSKRPREVVPSGNSFKNPFFRDQEAEFIGGDRAVISPNASIFSQDYLSKSSENVMERGIREELEGVSKRVVSGHGGRK